MMHRRYLQLHFMLLVTSILLNTDLSDQTKWNSTSADIKPEYDDRIQRHEFQFHDEPHVIKFTPQVEETPITFQPPNPMLTLKAVIAIRASCRKDDILQWRTKLLKSQEMFNKLKVKFYLQEKMTKVKNKNFTEWADRTEENISVVFEAIANRLKELENDSS